MVKKLFAADDRMRRLDELAQKVNQSGAIELPAIGRNIGPGLDKLIEQGNYGAYMLIGSSALEYAIRILVDTFCVAATFNAFIAEMLTEGTHTYEIDFRPDERATVGQLLKVLKDKFRFDLQHKDTYDKIDRFNKFRVEAAHSWVSDYQGDISKLDSELKAYVTSDPDPVHDVVESLMAVERSIAADLRMKKEHYSKLLES